MIPSAIKIMKNFKKVIVYDCLNLKSRGEVKDKSDF
jgi:hypothetical protein